MEVPLGDTYTFSFTTRNSSGLPTTLLGIPAVSVKEEGNDTIITTGITLDVDTGATPVTGLNEVAIVATGGNGYEVGKYYNAYLSAGTVAGTSVVGEVVGHFRIVAAESEAGVKETALTAAGVDAIWDELLSGHTVAGSAGNAQILDAYAGPVGPGVYVEQSATVNTGTVVGLDGTPENPVSAVSTARTIADSIGLKVIYLGSRSGPSKDQLATSYPGFIFYGLHSPEDVIIDFSGQACTSSLFYNLTVEGPMAASTRVVLDTCIIREEFGAGVTTLAAVWCRNCGFKDEVTFDTSANNILDNCYSLVAGTAAPIFNASGAAGTLNIRHWSGGIEFRSLSASHNVSIEGMGQIIFDASCNVNATVAIRGLFTITDNTAGMNNLSQDARIDIDQILAQMNAGLDTAIPELAQAVPAATPSTRTALMLLYMMARNQLIVQTSGTDAIEIYNDAGVLICKKLITDVGGDYTEAEMVAGP